MTRTVVISGGGTGIGLAIAGRFADRGDEVVTAGRPAGVLARGAGRLGVQWVCADLSTADGAELLAEQVDRVDVVVANAGSRSEPPCRTLDESPSDTRLMQRPPQRHADAEQSLQRRAGTATEVAGVVGFVASDEGGSMNKGTMLDKIGIWLTTDLRVKRQLRFVPGLMARRWRRLYAPVYGTWAAFTRATPEALRGVVGIGRDPEAEQKAFEEGPLPSLLRVYPNAHHRVRAGMWHAALPTAPRMMRGFAAIERTARRAPANVAAQVEPEELTARVRAKAAELGLSAIGVARYDPKYTFEPYLGAEVGDRMIVCAVEQHYESTQQIPSSTGERAALSAYAEGMRMTAALAEFIQDLGYRAEAHSAEGHGVMIHYGVASGLGQLGLNGQLLTPAAGSRCRLLGISTDAPLVFDSPKDYGINKLCDECRVCQQRCPANAIPMGGRRVYRGIEKAKINIDRCLPVMAAADGCAVCTKVCPVQRFGLAAVYDEFERTGKILGKGTDDLEAFYWPLDGKTYVAGKRPRVSTEVFFKLDGR